MALGKAHGTLCCGFSMHRSLNRVGKMLSQERAVDGGLQPARCE